MKPAVFATLMTAAAVVAAGAGVTLVRLIPAEWIGSALIAVAGMAAIGMVWGVFYQIGESRL